MSDGRESLGQGGLPPFGQFLPGLDQIFLEAVEKARLGLRKLEPQIGVDGTSDPHPPWVTAVPFSVPSMRYLSPRQIMRQIDQHGRRIRIEWGHLGFDVEALMRPTKAS